MRDETKISVLSANKKGPLYDESFKNVMANKEIIVPILQMVVPEFKDFDQQKILECLDVDSISRNLPVSDSVDYRIQEQNTEYSSLYEKLLRFDEKFLVKNPLLSDKDKKIAVYLHIDLEGQKSYRPSNPAYPIETRGMYYMARDLSSQLGIITKETDYSMLEKCYSIWICSEKVPKHLQNTVTMYSVKETNLVGEVNLPERYYDLMSCIIIRRGKEEDNGLFDFLQGLFAADIQKLEQYSHIEWSESFEKEVNDMKGLGYSLLSEGYDNGMRDGKQIGIQLGMDQCKKLMIRKALSNGKTIEFIKDAYDCTLSEIEDAQKDN